MIVARVVDTVLDAGAYAAATATVGQATSQPVVLLGSPATRRLLAVVVQQDDASAPRVAANLLRLVEISEAVQRYELVLAVGPGGGAGARVVLGRVLPGNIDTVVTLFQNVVMHAATAQQGFRRGLLLVDRAADRVLSIGIWQDHDSLRRSESNGYFQRQVAQFGHVIAAPPVVAHFDVLAEGVVPQLGLRPDIG